MLTLIVRFQSSWTNSFATDHGRKPRFTSGRALQKSVRNLKPPAAGTEALAGGPGSRLSYLQALQAANPGMAYRVPENFDSTVQGILARLVGEIRRLHDIQSNCPDHLALRAFKAGDYRIDVEHEHSETMRLSTPGNEILSAGAGVLKANTVYDDQVLNRYFFGHLEYEFSELLDILTSGSIPEGNWLARSPVQIVERLDELLKQQKKYIKGAQENQGNKKTAYVSSVSNSYNTLRKYLSKEIDDWLTSKQEQAEKDPDKQIALTLNDGALDDWPLAGALVVARVRSLSNDERQSLIDRGILTKQGNLSGLSMTKGVGGRTPKDLYQSASGTPAMSYRIPYNVRLIVKYENSDRVDRVDTGVLVRSGTLHFSLEDPALAEELYQAIRQAGVGPFHFGKKGVAYIEQLTHRGDPSRHV